MYNSIEVEIKKWGNSLGLRISKPLAEFLNIKEGSKIVLTLRENRVELRVLDEEGNFIVPEMAQEVLEEEGAREEEEISELKTRRKKIKRKAPPRGKERFYRLEKINVFKMPRFESPLYDSKFKGRKTPITLRDGNLTKIIQQYPFVVVVFWDFLYLDFYESIKRRINYMKKLAELFSGYCWFVIVNVENYPDLRKRFIGNAWSELEILGFVNGKKVFEGYTVQNLVPAIQAISGHYLTGNGIQELDDILKVPSLQSINTEEDFLNVLSEQDELIICFQLPPDRAAPKKLARILELVKHTPYVVNSYDFAYFDEKTESFEENPIQEKFDVTEFPSFLLLKRREGENDEVEILEEKKVNGKLSIRKIAETMNQFFGDKEDNEKKKK